MAQTVLVTGATGYVGGRLAPLLVEEGFGVRVLVRTAAKVAKTQWASRAQVIEGDALDPKALDTALAGVDTAFYLLHSISTGAKFDDLEASMARTFAEAAARNGVQRIVYLGGIANDEHLSKHLESRRSVGKVLASTGVPVIELRAGIIIGSGSASFEMLRYLTEHLPAMITPRWVDNPTQPVAIVNMLHFLVAAARAPREVQGVFDVGGPETLSYREMMKRFAKAAGLRRRVIVKVPLLTPRISSMWVGLVTPVPASIARPLIDSLINKVVVDKSKSVLNVLPPPPEGLLTFDQALKRALERTNAPTRWTDASRPWVAWDVAVTDPAWTGGSLFVDERERITKASREQVW
ncbi:MAG: NAD(P)H-binding protein, partial [Ilumatobacteraceae bacterium]